MSHARFLRDSGTEEASVVALIGAFWRIGGQSAAVAAEETLRAVDVAVTDITDGADRQLLHYVARLALVPGTVNSGHVEALRADGYSDRDVSDVVHVVGCFSYMNRLADGLGVTISAAQSSWAQTLLGESAVAQHWQWSKRSER